MTRATVTPMEARCAVCLDTGSKDQDMASDLDCTACDAPAKRIALRHYLTQFTNWSEKDTVAWASYQFAQRQAAPVAQPAQQVEAAIPAAWVIKYPDGVRVAVIGETCPQSYRKYATPLYAAPQLEAQQAGDVALKAARYEEVRTWSPRRFAEVWGLNNAGNGAFDDLVDAAITQGRKA